MAPRDGEIEIHREYPKAAPTELAMAGQDHEDGTVIVFESDERTGTVFELFRPINRFDSAMPPSQTVYAKEKNLKSAGDK